MCYNYNYFTLKTCIHNTKTGRRSNCEGTSPGGITKVP